MSVQELELVVKQLPPHELAQFDAWYAEFKADEWDRQIEADARAGKLDHLVLEADTEFEAGRCTLL